MKLATDPVLWQVEKLCALLAEKDNLKSAGHIEATSLQRVEASSSSFDNRLRHTLHSIMNIPFSIES